MTCEIDKDFYCTNAEDFISSDGTEVRCDTDHFCETCRNMRRKWPTPEQLREERGVEWQEGWPVWVLIRTISKLCDQGTGKPFPDRHSWILRPHKNKKDIEAEIAQSNFYSNFSIDKLEGIVCACTDWGKPADDWRPS